MTADAPRRRCKAARDLDGASGASRAPPRAAGAQGFYGGYAGGRHAFEGDTSFLQKPFTPEGLSEKVAELLASDDPPAPARS